MFLPRIGSWALSGLSFTIMVLFAPRRPMPIFPGNRYEDWDLDDPAGQGLTPCDPSVTKSGRCLRTCSRRTGEGQQPGRHG